MLKLLITFTCFRVCDGSNADSELPTTQRGFELTAELPYTTLERGVRLIIITSVTNINNLPLREASVPPLHDTC